MTQSRRTFIKTTAVSSLPLAAGVSPYYSMNQPTVSPANDPVPSIIGHYGPWAAALPSDPPQLSFRREEYNNIDAWRQKARQQVADYLGSPDVGTHPKATVHQKYTYDGLDIEELSWQLPYGRATQAVLLKPTGATEPLPGILGLHDHGGNKYFGLRKITRTGDQHPLMVPHQEKYYSGRAWANELAKRGFVVLVPDAFVFGSRRIHYEDVSDIPRLGLDVEGKTDENSEQEDYITAYNQWAGKHEHVLSKSLFCAGTTWPGVFLTEDQRALDVLCARNDVDAERVGCSGLSGGGLRTAYLGGLDPRVACAVCVGFMTTWNDFLLNRAYTHTWMTYIPRVPEYLDFPEIYGLRAPLPTLVLNNREDQLFTLPEMQRADTILQEVFSKVGASEQYQANFYPGLHKFDADMQEDAFAWFERWLS